MKPDATDYRSLVLRAQELLSAARTLLEREATPASERAAVHIESAHALLLSDSHASASSVAEPFVALTRRLIASEQVKFAECSYVASGRFGDFLRLLVEACQRDPAGVLTKSDIIAMALDSGYLLPGVRTAGPLLQHLRSEKLIAYAGGNTYRFAEAAKQIASAMPACSE